MKKYLVCLVAVLLLSVGCFAADFDGYIVRIKDNTFDNLKYGEFSVFSDGVLFGEINDSDAVRMIAEEIDEVNEINSEHMLLKAENMESLQQLIDMGIVESYEEDSYLELFGYDYSKNAYYNQQWYLDYINADFAWDAGIYGNGVKVAVIDSGINPIEDLTKNLELGKNYESGKDELDTSDNVSHGTSVAGIIASSCNELATIGISFNASLVPLRVTYVNSNNDTVVSTSAAVDAIYDAVDYFECDVINMSFGSDKRSTEFENAVNYAVDKGTIVVAATGNYGEKPFGNGVVINPPMYPAYYENCIGVGNAERFGGILRIKSSSGYNDRVTIAAPGTGIKVVNKTTTVDGTSFSSPMVAAAAALVKSIDPSIGQAEFKSLITSTANKTYIEPSGQSADKWGAGLLDIKAMLMKLLSDNGFYKSPVNTVNGESYFVITNTGSNEDATGYAVTLSEYSSGKVLTKFELVKDIILAPGQSKEISLTTDDNVFTSNAVIDVYDDHTPGDLNNDGKINILDASILLRHLSNYKTDIVLEGIDVNGDGSANILDVSALLRYIAKYLVKLH